MDSTHIGHHAASVGGHHGGAQHNQRLHMSKNGMDALRRHEGVVHHHYNDAVGNCTLGAGTLVHTGRCTADELHSHVTNAQINHTLHARVEAAARTVRHGVPDRALTQHQFDALVSFVYNVGAGNARTVLHEVNRGNFHGAAHHIRQYVHATVRAADGQPERDANGHIISRVLPGLVRRRDEESAPFRTQNSTHIRVR